jgi:hypothetical protein
MLQTIKNIFGKDRESQDSGPASTSNEALTRGPTSGVGGTASRKQMLAVVLRETLLRNTVPSGCVGMEFFRTMDRSGARNDGIHVRLVLRDLHEELAGRIVALERDFRRRLTAIDWRAAEWLQGVSWQMEFPEEHEAADADTAANDPAAARAAGAAIRTRPSLAGDGPAMARARNAREEDARGLTRTSPPNPPR